MKLREARAKKLFSVRELAKRAGMSESNLYHIEMGSWLPSLGAARKLAEAVGVDPAEIDEIRAAIDKASRREPRKSVAGSVGRGGAADGH